MGTFGATGNVKFWPRYQDRTIMYVVKKSMHVKWSVEVVRYRDLFSKKSNLPVCWSSAEAYVLLVRM